MTKDHHSCADCCMETFKSYHDDIINMYELDYDYINSKLTIYVDVEDTEIPVIVDVEAL